MLSVGSAFAQKKAGVFRLPFNQSQTTWYQTTCNGMGFTNINPSGLVFMELNTGLPSGIPKYHLGEDWNGVCGGETDRGAELYAIADATVEFTRMDGNSGGWLLLRLSLPDGVTFRYILYEHILDIAINPRTNPARPFTAGDAVYQGEVVAHIGNGNGVWQYHLHSEMRRDTSLDPVEANPYQNPLTIETALKYTSPSLFIDDRRNPFTQALTNGAWTYLQWYLNAPSSTAFIEYNGERYSLKRAIQLGYIYQYVYEQRSGQWYYYPDVANVFFGSGNTYAIWSFVNGAVLNILVPGGNLPDDRSKIDMLHAAGNDSRFTDPKTDIKTETFYKDTTGADWGFRQVRFGSPSGRTLAMLHATNKVNPLWRYTMHCEFTANQWQCDSWAQVNPNTLD